MKKVILDLGRINKGMRLKFNLILDSNEYQNNKNLKIFNSFVLGGNTYYKLNPHPFITIDIGSSFDKTDDWNASRTVTLNMLSKMHFEKMAKEMIVNFRIPDLFYYQSQNKLLLNKELSKKYTKYINYGNNRKCAMMYCVIPDESNDAIYYEGVALINNSRDNYCLLTYDELCLLYYSLYNVNMYQLSLTIINIINSKSYVPRYKDNDIEITKDVIEEVKEPVIENKLPIQSDEIKNIPNF